MKVRHLNLVGWSEQYRDDGAMITRWGRVLTMGIKLAIVEPLHGMRVPRVLINISSVHTVMPSSY